MQEDKGDEPVRRTQRRRQTPVLGDRRPGSAPGRGVAAHAGVPCPQRCRDRRHAHHRGGALQARPRAGGGHLRLPAGEPGDGRHPGLGGRRRRGAPGRAPPLLHRLAGAAAGNGHEPRPGPLPLPRGEIPRGPRPTAHPRAAHLRDGFHEPGERHLRPLPHGGTPDEPTERHGSGRLEQGAHAAPAPDAVGLPGGPGAGQRRHPRAVRLCSDACARSPAPRT